MQLANCKNNSEENDLLENAENNDPHNHGREHRTPKKSAVLIDGEELLDKINILTTRLENQSNSAKLPTIKDFVVIKPISRGAFGKVFLGYKNNDPNKLYAIKMIRKSDLINKNMVSQVVTERNALALSRSPFCVNLFYSLQTSSNVYLVMEYMVGGDLKSLLAMYGYFDEEAARFYAVEVALALQYLHEHGIVHRDIKPDNMLLSSTGHVKLTDFGLSKIEMRRDLEISDLLNCSPNLNTRTPGQLLSLTSHLSFGSEKKLEYAPGVSNFLSAINRHNLISELSDSDVDTSLTDPEKTGDSKISGVSPFFSAEDINVSVSQTCANILVESSSSYHTCTSSEFSKTPPLSNEETTTRTKPTHDNRRVEFALNCEKTGISKYNDCKCNDKNTLEKYNVMLKKKDLNEEADSFELSLTQRRSLDEPIRHLKGQEDSGVSSRKSDCSNSNTNVESSPSYNEKSENLCNYKDDFYNEHSKSSNLNNTNELSNGRLHSPFRNILRGFKRPEYLRCLKRKINIVNRSESHFGMDDDGSSSCSTGLTQEIDILGLGSSTPKKRKSKSPIRSVLKVRSLSDDEVPQLHNEIVTNVVFSTPVSSQKAPRRENGLLCQLKATRFALPSSFDSKKCEQTAEKALCVQYLKMADDPTMSPINLGSNLPKTPKKINTPFRTPKSVRRGGGRASFERILGTPDYLAPEILMKSGHGPAVDWWALGVCLYEFMTGIPPFNDETPQKVFDNILNKNIEWPEDEESLTPDAMEAVELLLTMDPAQRPSAIDVQKMNFFAGVDWNNHENEMPPFIPAPDNPTDTIYFDARNNLQNIKLSNFSAE